MESGREKLEEEDNKYPKCRAATPAVARAYCTEGAALDGLPDWWDCDLDLARDGLTDKAWRSWDI